MLSGVRAMVADKWKGRDHVSRFKVSSNVGHYIII